MEFVVILTLVFVIFGTIIGIISLRDQKKNKNK